MLAQLLERPGQGPRSPARAEALTNAAKHARASYVNVNVSRSAGRAVIEVADDGVGGADLRRGSGLRGLRDRVEARGGELDLESREGDGTTLTARLPCPSQDS